MPSAKKKILLGAAGAVGAGIVSWRTLFPWISYDLKFMKIGMKVGKKMQQDLANCRFILNMFDEAVAKHPKKPFIIFEDRIYTYEYMNDQANRVANIASKWGVNIGECVAIMIQNEPAFIWTFLGLQKLGIAVAFLNFHVRGQSLVHTIHACEAKVLIVGEGENLQHGVEEIRSILNGLPIYVQGGNLEFVDGYRDWDDEMRLVPPLPVCASLREGVNIDTHCCYIFTSGTTGLPKPVVISQAKALSISHFFQLIEFVPSDIVYTTTPLYHSAAGGIGLMGVLNQGATMVLRRKFSAHHFFEDVRRHNCTVIQYIGELCRYLLTVPEHPLDPVHNVRVAIGSGLRTDIWDRFVKRYKIPLIREYFGATEGAAAMMNIENKFGACGRISPFLSPLDGVHSIRAAIGNGLRGDIWEQFKKRFRIPYIYEFFGATEGAVILLNVSNVTGSCGRLSPFLNKLDPAPKYLVRFDIETGEAVRDKHGRCIPVVIGEPGLLISWIPPLYSDLQFYKGGREINEKKVIRNVFKEGDQYFNFGDVLSLDKDYFAYFKDRIGDTFRWKGENVATYEVSNILTQLDFVHDANVYGVEIHGTDGRAGMAALHFMENIPITDDKMKEIYDHCQEYLPSYARPLFLRFPKEHQLTVTWKQQKMQLKRDGFDPSLISDPLYFLDEKRKTYTPLNLEHAAELMVKSRL